MSINGFPIQILLPKSKEERTKVISRLLSFLLQTNCKNICTFLIHFHTCFTIMMSQVQKIFIQSIVTRCLKAIKSILIHEYQHKSTRVNTNQYESDTNQHESDTSQHESTQVRHKSTRINTSQKVS